MKPHFVHGLRVFLVMDSTRKIIAISFSRSVMWTFQTLNKSRFGTTSF
jgi:hypothetical protein